MRPEPDNPRTSHNARQSRSCLACGKSTRSSSLIPCLLDTVNREEELVLVSQRPNGSPGISAFSNDVLIDQPQTLRRFRISLVDFPKLYQPIATTRKLPDTSQPTATTLNSTED